jgi:hypothetical protein
MKKQPLSFRDFLTTGNLGVIRPGMKLIEVAKELGAPTWWNINAGEIVPEYWGYGDNLEISFDETPPHFVNWFQLEHAGYLEGDFAKITDRVVLALEGLSGKTKPSEFLSAGLWLPESVSVSYHGLSDDIAVAISAGPVVIYFRVDTNFITDGDASAYLARTDFPQLISTLDRQADMLDSIYSLPHPAIELIESQSEVMGWKSLSGSDYLTLAKSI